MINILFTFGASITSWKLTFATSGLVHYRGKETTGFELKLRDNFIVFIDTTEVVDVQIDSKLNFLHHVDHIFFQIIRYFGLIRNVTTSFCYPNSPPDVVFYISYI